MKDLWETRWGKILIVVGGGLLIGLFVFLASSSKYNWLFWPILGSLLSMAVLWFGIDFAVRAAKRRREDTFDAGLAAKEGIEDRRREWSNWTAELKKQGVDRYELPFYLLVGEPQSGKSILLQNSDLHFPFGQTRLSGIGGTRGCDWWFTEEAVILDLAGRLFTHEGGASDEAEWQAFLDLLVEYRPMCPANGILLVIPCDRLIQDTPDKAAAKANRIQGALVTLTNKLQARVPVYVVLTKADKIFGFAEAVHRLEAPKRQEMFGWSRDAASFEAPFDGEEARRGFESLVERARALRAQMLATARVPDALAEVDRLYAFPDELAALQPTLAVYLQRIFAESTLVDRLYFRGLYLTSGLQTGAPIAKVCADLFKGSREADTRNLEALFTKQRAYFIKDLVRKRVFAERGLVRPTRGRVMRARRNAWIGYGVAAAIAVAGIAGSIAYLFSERSKQEENTYGVALERVQGLIERDGEIPDTLRVLERLRQAIAWDRAGIEDVFSSSKSAFRDLYEDVFDARLAPKLRERVEEAIAEAPDPTSYREFEKRIADIDFVLSDIDLADAAHAERVVALVPDGERRSPSQDDLSSGKRSSSTLSLGEAIDLRADYGTPRLLELPEPSRRSATLKKTIDKAEELWDGVLRRNSRWQVVSDLGYVLACAGLIDAHQELSSGRVDDGTVHDMCDAFGASCEALEESEAELDTQNNQKVVRREKLEGQLKELEEQRAEFLERVRGPVGSDERWSRALAMQSLIDSTLESCGRQDPRSANGVAAKAGAWVDKGKNALLGDACPVPTAEVARILENRDLIEVCDRSFLPVDVGDLDELVRQVRRGIAMREKSGIAMIIFNAKCRAVGTAYRNAYGDEKKLLPHLKPVDDTEDAALEATTRHLLELRFALVQLPDDANLDWVSHVENLLNRCEDRLLESWSEGMQAGETRSSGMSSFMLLESQVRALRDYVAGMQQVPTGGRPPRTPASHGEWLQRVDAHFAQSIGELEEQYRQLWPPLAPQERDGLLRVAQQIGSRLGRDALRDRITHANENGGRRLSADLLKDAEFESSLDRAKKALGDLARISSVPSALEANRIPRVVQLREQAGQFGDRAGLADDGPALAGILWKAQNTAAESSKDALELYLDDLRKALMEEMAAQVQRRLIADFEQQSKDLPVLFDELFDEPKRKPVDDDQLVEQLGRLFDDGRVLDTLREQYKLKVGEKEKPLEFWTAEEKLGTNELRWKKTIEFLTLLQAFLRGTEGAQVKDAAVRNSKITCTITPDLSDPASIWRVRRLQFFQFPRDARGGRLEYEAIDGQGRPAIEWDFVPRKGKALTLRWTVSNKPDVTDPDDAMIEIDGSLAPLLLAWRGAAEKDKHRFTGIPDDSKLAAPMEIRFGDRVLPTRPARPQ